MTRRYLEPSEVPALLLRAFPAYTGRKFAAVVCEAVSLHDAYWSGGSRSTYRALELATGRTCDPVSFVLNPPQFGGAARAVTVPLPSGWVIVQHSIFCGKDAGLTFHIRAENAAPLLPGPVALGALSRAALVVLHVSCSYKAFARRDEAARLGVRGAGYDSGLAECKAVGLVNAAGAVTVRGDNARADLGLSDSSLRLPRAEVQS